MPPSIPRPAPGPQDISGPCDVIALRHGLSAEVYRDREARRARQRPLLMPGARSEAQTADDAKRRYYETMAGLTNGRGA